MEFILLPAALRTQSQTRFYKKDKKNSDFLIDAVCYVSPYGRDLRQFKFSMTAEILDV
jgi:hypothetical protein